MSHNKMVMDNLIAVTGFFQMILESEPRGGGCGMRRPLALYKTQKALYRPLGSFTPTGFTVWKPGPPPLVGSQSNSEIGRDIVGNYAPDLQLVIVEEFQKEPSMKAIPPDGRRMKSPPAKVTCECLHDWIVRAGRWPLALS